MECLAGREIPCTELSVLLLIENPSLEEQVCVHRECNIVLNGVFVNTLNIPSGDAL